MTVRTTTSTVRVVRRLPRPLPGDVALAVACAAIEVSSAALHAHESSGPRVTVLSTVLLIAAAVPLAWRRHAPIAVIIATGGLHAVYGIAPYPDPFLPLAPLIAFATVIELAS